MLERASARGGSLQVVSTADPRLATKEAAPAGRWLRATTELAGGAAIGSASLTVIVPLPDGVDLARHEALSCIVRAPAADDRPPPGVELFALDASGARLFRRPLRAAPRERWSTVGQPLFLWRWSDRVGSWSDVRSVAIVVTGGPSLEVDTLVATAGTRGVHSAAPPPAWLPTLAFTPPREAQRPDGEGDEDEEPAAAPALPARLDAGAAQLLVDPSIPPDPAAVERIAARARPLVAWLDRVAAGAIAPIDDRPVELLVLADPAAHDRYLQRLARQWRVHIRPVGAIGYTLQDIAGVPHDPAWGLDRPMVLHELVHAVVARRLRLRPGRGEADWLQEAFANYLQLSLFPEAFDREGWPAVVERGRPLAEVVKDVDPGDYAALSGLLAFLLAERPAWVGSLARSIAGGKSTAAAVKACPGGATLEALDRDWRHWARRTLCDAKAPPDAPHWPPPEEWRRP